jgi:hypothetical protein
MPFDAGPFSFVEAPVNERKNRIFVEARHRKLRLAETSLSLLDQPGRDA